LSLLRLLHTVRYLRPVQVYGRLAHRLRRRVVDRSAPPPLRGHLSDWWQPALRAPSFTAPDTFTFLNHRETVVNSDGWNRASLPRLWRYNLHYFDDLVAAGAPERRAAHRALIARWIAEHVPLSEPGWEPYPTSVRIVNWIKWAAAGAENDSATIASLAIQVRSLERQLEHHILGNHLWANAKALTFAGAFFGGAEGDRWLKLGIDIVVAELSEQILEDGGHYERSPMYHAIVLEDVLDLVNLGRSAQGVLGKALEDRLRTTATAMLRWLRLMTHPDGQISFFNDSAFGISADYTSLASYASRLGVPVSEAPTGPLEVLAQSGYARLENGRAVAICDVAPVGPDHQPGHAHADTLSFELSVDGRRIVVNGGTSTYDLGGERARQRSTSAHSTVVVDGADSSEVWSAFRVARRARPRDVSWGNDASGVWVEGSHDGYRRLKRPVTHRRRWLLAGGELVVHDWLQGQFGTAVAHFPLHPSVSIEGALDRQAAALHAGELSCDVIVEGGSLSPRRTTWHPEFGKSVECVALDACFERDELVTRIEWR
jgi:uncharacterized heparinase superfamily protein